MELVDRARDDLEPSRAVSVYVRLHQVYGQDADRLHQRVLVSLGRRAPTALSFAAANGDDDGIATPRSVLGQIRKRLRGRVNLELREWVEYHTGRTETDLLWAHVENAAEFIEILQPIMAVGEAVELYTASLDVPATRAEIIYYLVLAHRSSASEPVVTAETRAARLTLVRKDSTIRSIRATARRGEVHEISG